MSQVVLDAWSRFAFSYLTSTGFAPKDWGIFKMDEPVGVDSKRDIITKLRVELAVRVQIDAREHVREPMFVCAKANSMVVPAIA
jgi:hypothetical protein